MLKQFLATFLAIFFLVQSSVSAKAETITIVADSWCPYNCEPGTEKPGYMIEIAQKVFEKQGISVEYSILPWTRAIDETRAGKHTAIVGAAHEDSPDFVFPEANQGRSQEGFFVKKGSAWRFNGIESLEGISIGAIAGYAYNDVINDYIEKNKDEFKSVQLAYGDDALNANVKKLLLGRIGALVENVDVMAQYINENNKGEEIEFAGSPPTDVQSKLYIAFSPANPNAKKYADILSQGTKAMRESGELKEIMARYGLEEFSQEQ